MSLSSRSPLSVLLLILLLQPFLLHAQEPIQPALGVYLPDAEDAPTNVIALTERINSDLLRRLNRRNRFVISVEEGPEDLDAFAEALAEDPPEETDVIILGALDQRRDGSYRYLYEIWSARLERFTFSQEFDARGLVAMGNEDAIILLSREVQQEVEEALLELFPGFGWLEFVNQGTQDSYEVLINEESVGTNLTEISLLPGSWKIEILQEIDDEVYVMARDEVALGPEDYYELIFELASEPPAIPGYLRVERTADDWRVGIEAGYDYLIPISELSEDLFVRGDVIVTRVVFNDLPIRNLIMGIDTGLGSFAPLEDGQIETNNEFIPLLGFLGYRFGPLGGVDFTLKAAGGVQLAIVEYTFAEGVDPEDQPIEDDQYVATVRGSVEFGFNWGRYLRIHAGTSLWSFIEEQEALSFIGLHAGLGIKF